MIIECSFWIKFLLLQIQLVQLRFAIKCPLAKYMFKICNNLFMSWYLTTVWENNLCSNKPVDFCLWKLADAFCIYSLFYVVKGSYSDTSEGSRIFSRVENHTWDSNLRSYLSPYFWPAVKMCLLLSMPNN